MLPKINERITEMYNAGGKEDLIEKGRRNEN